MKPTKKFILEHALHLFNQNGFVNVRLQHIADECSISVGNLAYHFKNKDAIIKAIYQQINKKQDTLLAEFRVMPLFEDIDYLLQKMFALQMQYKFFYLDTIEVLRAYPTIKQQHQNLLFMQRKQIDFMFEFNLSRGAFMPPKYDNQFAELRHIFCMGMDSWLSYQFINGNEIPRQENFCDDMWTILNPLFSESAFEEYDKLGNDWLKKI